MKRILLILLLINFFFECFSQKLELDFNQNRIALIDSIAEIGYDSITSERIDKSEFEKLYDNSFSKNEGYGSVYMLNKGKTQFFRLSSKGTDGYWNDYFTVGYTFNKEPTSFLNVSNLNFTSYQFIKLGLSEKQLVQFVKKQPDCILSKGQNRILKYYWFNKQSLDYQVYKIPTFVASFIFSNKKLIKFGFGEYRAELDKDFFPKEYNRIKGKTYQ